MTSRREKPRVEKKRKPVMAWAVFNKSDQIMQESACGPFQLYQRRSDARHHVKSVCYGPNLKVVRVRISIVK